MEKRLLCLLGGWLSILSGCSGPIISMEIRREALPIRGFAEVRQNPEKFMNNTIIIGGEIISTINRENQATTLLVLDRPLDNNEQPEKWKNSQGRFMVHTTHFLDPEIYTKGREVTVAGIVTGVEKAPVGKTDYPYVVLKARQIYLWPGRYRPYTYPMYPYWSPDWYPDGYGDFWGPPWWGPPPEGAERRNEQEEVDHDRDSGAAQSKPLARR